MSSEIKAGDFVRVVDGHHKHLPMGAIFQVSVVTRVGFVYLVGQASNSGWYPDRFEKVEPLIAALFKAQASAQNKVEAAHNELPPVKGQNAK